MAEKNKEDLEYYFCSGCCMKNYTWAQGPGEWLMPCLGRAILGGPSGCLEPPP